MSVSGGSRLVGQWVVRRASAASAGAPASVASERRGRPGVVPVAAAIVVVLAACGGDEADAGAAGGSRATPPLASTPTAGSPGAGLTPAPVGVEDEVNPLESRVPIAVPTWDAASRASSVAAAERVLRAFADTGGGRDRWWAGLSPLLSAQAQGDYAYVDPDAVPVSEVTGTGELVDDTSAYVAWVEVPTDVGRYTVVLSRVDATAPWLAERLVVPQGVG